MSTVATIVEGNGDVLALPVLIRTLAFANGFYDIDVPRPFRLARDKFTVPGELGRAVEFQARHVQEGNPVLVLLDADNDCALKLSEDVARTYEGPRRLRVVVAVREYESIFLAGMSHRDPETVRGAKELLRKLTGEPYHDTVHQAKYSARLELPVARECRWFRKLEKELLAILRG